MGKMKFGYLLLYVVLFVSTVSLVGCGSDESDPEPEPSKSNAKAITSFKFSGLAPEVAGVVDESKKTVALTVLKGTNVTALVPTIAVSEKSSVAPASGVAQNFTNPVTYTVTAEDGSTQDYVVTVTVSQTVTFEVDEFEEGTEIQQDDIFIVTGDGFSGGTSKVVLKNVETETEYTYTPTAGSGDEIIYLKAAADLPVGNYTVTVFVGTQSLELENTVAVVRHHPMITAVDKTTVAPEATIVITGKYFGSAGQNKVYLTQDGFQFKLTIISESATSITAKLPENIFEGDHELSVVSHDVEVTFDGIIEVTEPPTPKPTITNIQEFIYNRGETMIITGTNLKKAGVATNIVFTPFTSGVGTVRSGIANAAGTQVTFAIPPEFPVGTYVITVEVDFVSSEEYGDVIKIQ
ncbi:DUF5018 domain-containing protein [Pseudochryseolinea flava]|nr:DUF5018 domain-containing protein [Pseudochryseolinea flava]